MGTTATTAFPRRVTTCRSLAYAARLTRSLNSSRALAAEIFSLAMSPPSANTIHILYELYK